MANRDQQDLARLASEDPRLVASAAQRLAQASQPPVEAAVPLVRRVGIADEEAREWITAALEGLGAPATADLPSLADLLSAYLQGDHPADVGYWAATLLGRAGQHAAPQVALLESCSLTAKHLSVRERAIWALGKLGPAAASAKATLEQLSRDPAPRISRLAHRALASLSSGPS